MSTLTWADLYGNKVPGTAETPPPQPVAKMSGLESKGDVKPASLWVGMVIALVVLRLAWEMAESG